MVLKSVLTGVISKLPYIGKVYQENINLKKNACYPPGHYYSAIISVDDVKNRENSIWDSRDIDGINGINIQAANQLSLLGNIAQFYSEMPFKATEQPFIRYYFENGFYSYTDGILLYSMIRYLRPKTIVEVGSGFSSALMMDTNELFFSNTINLTFIEPYPDRLHSLMSDEDSQRTTVIAKPVQSIPLEHFEQLEAGDILFIDSTHVVKTGSDVNYILFTILPVLKKGVFIHFHDIFYPFEYPKDWVYKGFNWNEGYFLKAFLMYNQEFEIKLFADYMHKHHQESFAAMPLSYKNQGGSLWLQKN